MFGSKPDFEMSDPNKGMAKTTMRMRVRMDLLVCI